MRKTRRVPLALNFALGHIVGFARICWRKRYKLLLRTPILGDSRSLPGGAYTLRLTRLVQEVSVRASTNTGFHR